MKKKIAILGSTGSIGSTLLKVIDQKKYEINFLSANRNYKKILKQAKRFKIKNIIIIDNQSYLRAKKINKDKKLKIYNNYEFKNIVHNKLDYVMSSITGIAGLKPTYEIIKFTKKIAVANKESLICAWPLIEKELKKNKTEFIPVDSEHFSIWSEIKNLDPKIIRKIFITASGGSLFKFNVNSLHKIKFKDVLKHPTWKMGKKITVDSATMMNKCFEIMEAKNIFNLNYDKIEILVHQDSYLHAIICYNNGISKLILHDTTMEIPIFNSIYNNNSLYNKITKLDLKKMNNLKLSKIDLKRFPVLRLLKKLPKKHSLFETVVVTINDFLVEKFLKKKIRFLDISKSLLKLSNLKNYSKYKYIYPKNVNDILLLNHKILKNLKTRI